MSTILKIILISFLFTACVQESEEVASTSRTSAFSSGHIKAKWDQSQLPLKININGNFNTNEIIALENSANSWTDSVQNQFVFFETSVNSNEMPKANTSDFEDTNLGIYKMDQWPSDLPGTALAVTQIFGEKHNIGSSSEYIKIKHADILINFENFVFTTDDSWGYDLESVVLHEMGHFLGLQHDKTSADESVMYPTISRYSNNRTPTDTDIQNLLALYVTPGHSVSENSQRSLVNAQGSSQEIKIIIEIYPDGKEIIKTNSGEVFEHHH